MVIKSSTDRVWSPSTVAITFTTEEELEKWCNFFDTADSELPGSWQFWEALRAARDGRKYHAAT